MKKKLPVILEFLEYLRVTYEAKIICFSRIFRELKGSCFETM